MRSNQPPAVATWLLKQFGCSPQNEAILGDLTECYRRRQSTLWYWRQVAIAIIGSRWREVRDYLDQGITFFRISGDHMRKAMAFVLAIVVGLSFFLLQAQAQFSEYDVRGLLGNHDDERMRVPGDEGRHDRAVDHT